MSKGLLSTTGLARSFQSSASARSMALLVESWVEQYQMLREEMYRYKESVDRRE
jgi:hypothetical protein